MPTLTRRECDVLRLLVEGYSNHEIANRLGIREQTVKDHVSRCSGRFTRAAASPSQWRRFDRDSEHEPLRS
jgi:FixJ family two-component response regulator